MATRVIFTKECTVYLEERTPVKKQHDGFFVCIGLYTRVESPTGAV